MPNRNRNTDVENNPMDKWGAMGVGMNEEVGVDIHTAQVTDEGLLHGSGNTTGALRWPQWEGNPQ